MKDLCITLKNMQKTVILLHQEMNTLDSAFFGHLSIYDFEKWRELCLKHGFFLDIVGYNIKGLSFVFSLSLGFVLKDETDINEQRYAAPYFSIRIRVRLTGTDNVRRNDLFNTFINGLVGLKYFIVDYKDTALNHNHSGKEIVIPFSLCENNNESATDLLPKLKSTVAQIVPKIKIILKHGIFNGIKISTPKSPKDGEFTYNQ